VNHTPVRAPVNHTPVRAPVNHTPVHAPVNHTPVHAPVNHTPVHAPVNHIPVHAFWRRSGGVLAAFRAGELTAPVPPSGRTGPPGSRPKSRHQ